MKNYISMVCASLLFSFANLQAMQLSQYNYTGAWVLPRTKWGQKTYVILGREERGTDRGLYDAFGGKRDRGERHPVVTAAREFFEEAITNRTLGWNERAVRNFIDLSSQNTFHIFGVNDPRWSAKNVLYLTDFSNRQIERFKKTFPSVRSAARASKNTEKDAIATVRWENLIKAIAQSNTCKNIQVTAEVIYMSGRKVNQLITLRPTFAKMLKGYAKGKYPSSYGRNKLIRYYTL